jgi:hypothetical protein
VLDELDMADDLTPQQVADELVVLHRLWLDQLTGQALYPFSRRGL